MGLLKSCYKKINSILFELCIKNKRKFANFPSNQDFIMTLLSRKFFKISLRKKVKNVTNDIMIFGSNICNFSQKCLECSV